MDIEYVKNPETNRYIKVDGPTYQRLKDQYHLQTSKRYTKPAPSQRHSMQTISDQQIKAMLSMPVVPSEGRGSRTRGWSLDAPQRGLDRHLLRDKCGDRCFLIPETEGFPICPRCVEGQCQCQIDCRGVAAAKIRAHQHKYTNLYDVIEQIEQEKCNSR